MKLLKEKLLLTNEKLVNFFEEISHLQGFFGNLLTFFQEIRHEIAEDDNDEGMREPFKHLLDLKTAHSINSVHQFQAAFDAITKNKPLVPTIKSEAKRLDEVKNCAYHRVKI